MEDVLDTFLVRVQGPKSVEQEERFLRKMTNLFKISKERRKISGDVKDIMNRLQEVAERFRRYKLDDVVARPATASVIDPRLAAMYTQVNKLVGMDKSSSELMSKLQLGDVSNTKMKIVSIVGIGGLGKTTLAKAVYDQIKGHFHCTAFVSVGRNPDLQKVLQMILISLDKQKYNNFNFAMLQDITGFIDELREFLQDNKRWKAAELVLPRHLQELDVFGIEFCKLPSCINPWWNLSQLSLTLEHVDEQELKLLGGMPELCYLNLLLGSSASIRNISHSDAVYFPKLRRCRAMNSIVLFVSNKDEGVAFHMWNGEDSIAMPCVSDDELLQTPRPSDPDDDELKKSEDELQQRRNQGGASRGRGPP